MVELVTIDPWTLLEGLSDAELDRLVSDLQAAQAARHATGRQTQVEHHAGADEGEG
jgi:hypothetical protein